MRVPHDFPLPTLLGAPWRLDVELALGRDGPDLVLVDAEARARRFVPRVALADGRFEHVANDGSTARIRGDASRHTRCTASTAPPTDFVGGAPVRATSPDRSYRALASRGGAPRPHHDDGRGRTLVFEHERGRLARVRSGAAVLDADALRAHASDDPPATNRGRTDSWFGECPADTVCDTEAFPPPEGFLDGPGIPGAVRRDVRPGSCRSHFVEHVGTRRGLAIEHGLGRLDGTGIGLPTVPSFPIVDFVTADELVVVRSRDLASPTYDDPTRDALYERLMRDGRDVERLLLAPLSEDGHVAAPAPAGVGGIRRIETTPARTVVLELVVRHGMASASQVAQIERARVELARRYGIELRVVEIP